MGIAMSSNVPKGYELTVRTVLPLIITGLSPDLLFSGLFTSIDIQQDNCHRSRFFHCTANTYKQRFRRFERDGQLSLIDHYSPPTSKLGRDG